MAQKQPYGRAPIEADEVLNVQQVSEIMRTSYSSANKLFNQTDFPGKKIPNIGWRVRKSDLFEYINIISKYAE